MCVKPHMHVREIVADALHPLHAYLSRCARALPLCKALSSEKAWTLWSQNKLADVLAERIDKLRVIDDCRLQCFNCHKAKPRVFILVKLDAAHFFKEACLARGLQRARLHLNRLARKRNVDAIRVKHGKKASGSLCKSTEKCPPLYTVVTFEEIVRAFE